MKYFLAGLLFWTFSFATAQVMLPAYQGVISKPVANVNSIITSGLVLNLDAAKSSNFSASTMLFNTGAYGVGPDLLFYQNTIYWNIYDNTASPFTFSPAANISNWHNYTVVNDATSNAKLYIDGVFKASAAYRSNTATTTLSIGGGGTNTNKWVGEIANFQAYNRVLTASEVLQNFNSLKGGFGY